MAIHMFSLIFSCFMLLFLYYAIKLCFYYVCKYIIKLKFMQDKKFKMFGQEI